MCYRCDICNQVQPVKLPRITIREVVHYAARPPVLRTIDGSEEYIEQPARNVEHERQICSACDAAIKKGIPLTVLRAQHAERLLMENAAYRERIAARLAADQEASKAARLVRDKAEQARVFGTADAFSPLVPPREESPPAKLTSRSTKAASTKTAPLAAKAKRNKRPLPRISHG